MGSDDKFDDSLNDKFDDIGIPKKEEEFLKEKPQNKEAQKEKESFDKDKKEEERKDAEAKSRREDERTTPELKLSFAHKSYYYLIGYSIFVGAILILQGLYIPKLSQYYSFHLSERTLDIFVGSTGVTILGLIGIILKGLFKNK